MIIHDKFSGQKQIMPILITDVQFKDTPEIIYVTLPLRNVVPSKVDIYSNSLFLKINYPPYFYELDLPHAIDAHNSVSKVGNGTIICELLKVNPVLWTPTKVTNPTNENKLEDIYKYTGTKAEIIERRKKAEELHFEEERKIKEKRLTEKREKERDLVRTQIKVEQEKRERIENLKKKEHDEACEGIRKWARETLEKKVLENNIVAESRQSSYNNAEIIEEEKNQQISRPDSGVTEIFGSYDLQEEEFVDDDDIDVEAIR